MTKEQFKILVKAMKAIYTQPSFIPDNDAFDVWYSMLKDMDYAVASRAVQMHIQTEERMPTVASIRNQAQKLTKNSEVDLNETEAWALVSKAIRRSAYYSEEEFKKLPLIVQKAVVNPAQLREWALMEDIDGKSMTVMQSNFMRTYRTEVAREKELRKLSPDILALISDAGILQESLRGTVIKNDESEKKSDESASSMGENKKLSNPMPEAARNKLQDKYKMRLKDQ